LDKKSPDSKIDLFIHEFWLPEWQIAKIKNYIYNFENINSFCTTIGLGQNQDVSGIKIFLMIEIIASTMLLAESLAALIESIITNPENLQDGFKDSNSARFYGSIESLNHDDYLKILSRPQKNSIRDIEICNLYELLDNFGKILIRFKVRV
jgi:hypothetical protein